MRTNSLITWGLTMLMAVGVALPATARDNNDWHGREKIRVIQVDRQEHDRVFLQWYSAQVHTYNDIDAECNTRVGDLLQLVDEVNGNQVWLTDQQNNRREIFAAGRTEVVFSRIHRTDVITNGNIANVVSPGDLVIVQGYLRADGGFLANKIRVIGHAWGWNNDDDQASVENTGGVRYWGNVENVDIASGVCEVNINGGIRRVRLARDGEVFYAGRVTALDTLRIGDRVVFYLDQDAPRMLEAYRLVILARDDVYPVSGHIFRYDPDRYLHRTGVGEAVNLQIVEGQVDYLATGPDFHKLAVRTDDGRSRIVYVSKTMNIYRGGARVSLFDVKASDRLHVSFREVNGNLFAARIEIR